MKKQYLDFTKTHYQMRRRLPKIGLRFASGANYLSDGDKGDKGDKADAIPKEYQENADDTDEIKAIKKIGIQAHNFSLKLGDKADKTVITELTEQVKKLQEGIEKMESGEISKMLKDINEKNEKLWKQVIELQEKALEDKEKAEGGKGTKAPLVSRKDVEDFVKATFDGVLEGSKMIGGKKSHAFAKIELNAAKAAEIFGYATFFEPDGADPTAFTGRYVDPTLYQRKRKRNLILDNFTIRRIDVPTLVYLIKVEDGTDVGSGSGDSGSAEWILSGEQKPMRSFRVTSATAEAKKVAIFSTVEDKLLRDVPSLERWIREDLMDEMKEEINDGLLNNNPAINPDAPLGLKTNATAYSATPAYDNAFATTTTTYIDQIFAIAARMSFDKEQAGIVFVSTDVYHRIMHLKDTTNAYLNNNKVYVNTLGQLFIGGVEVVEADEEDIPSTHVLAIARDLGFKIYAYGPMVFERGLNGEDFRYDRTSFRAYQEFLTFFPEQREKSVIYDTWANIKAAIEA